MRHVVDTTFEKAFIRRNGFHAKGDQLKVGQDEQCLLTAGEAVEARLPKKH